MKSAVAKKKETSLENFYINRFGKKLYSMFFEGYTEKLWGRHPKEIAADWGSQRVKGLSIKTLLKDMFSKAFGKRITKMLKPHLLSNFGILSSVLVNFGKLLLKNLKNLAEKSL